MSERRRWFMSLVIGALLTVSLVVSLKHSWPPLVVVTAHIALLVFVCLLLAIAEGREIDE